LIYDGSDVFFIRFDFQQITIGNPRVLGIMESMNNRKRLPILDSGKTFIWRLFAVSVCMENK